MWARGARSPEAPTLPWLGITGSTPRFRHSARSRMASGRMPEWALSRQLMRAAMRARVWSRGRGSPTPAAWLRIRFSCSWASWSGGMTTVANWPKPVLMP